MKQALPINRFLVLTACCLAVSLAGFGCGNTEESLSADSTCEDYLAQPSSARYDAAVRISSELNVENSGNPMWGASLDAACGGSPSKTLGELFRHEGSATEPTDFTEADKPVHGRFDATPGNGYTLEVSYDLRQLEVEVDIANASPGEAILTPIVNGQMIFTNTTPARNTEFRVLELPSISLFWNRAQLPSSADCDGEGFQFHGTTHCFLLNIRGEIDPALDADGVVQLEPNGEASIPLQPSPLGGTTVSEQSADALAKLIRSTRPSLVLVHIDGLESSLCETGLTGDTAALTGSGEVLADGGGMESC